MTRQGRRIPAFDPNASGQFAARVLRKSKAQGALIGRVAVWAWLGRDSERAFTNDVDVAVHSADLPAIANVLAQEKVKAQRLAIGGLNASIPACDVNTDFVDRSDKSWGDLSALFAQAIEAANRAGEMVSFGSERIALVPTEYLVTMKLATGDDDDEKDVERLLTDRKAKVDAQKVRTLIRQHPRATGLGRFEALLRRIGHKAARKDYL